MDNFHHAQFESDEEPDRVAKTSNDEASSDEKKKTYDVSRIDQGHEDLEAKEGHNTHTEPMPSGSKSVHDMEMQALNIEITRANESKQDQQSQLNGLPDDENANDFGSSQSGHKSEEDEGIQALGIKPSGSKPREDMQNLFSDLPDDITDDNQIPHESKPEENDIMEIDLELNPNGSEPNEESQLNPDQITREPVPGGSKLQQDDIQSEPSGSNIEHEAKKDSNEPKISKDEEILFDELPDAVVKESMSNLHMVQMDSDDEPVRTDGQQNKDLNDDTAGIGGDSHCAGNQITSIEPDVNKNHKSDSLTVNSSSSDQFATESLFDQLPYEIVNYIFSFLSTQDLGRSSSVCKKFHTYASDPVFWTKIDFKCKDTDVNEVCRVIEQLPYVREIRLCGLEDLSDEDMRQIVSVCPDTVKSLNIGFQRCLGRDCILAILEYLPYLNKLNMEGCSAVNNNTVTALIKLKSLTDLNISHCSFVDDIHVQQIVSNLPLLEVLDINGLADVSETAIRRLWQHCGTWLRELYVDGASLTDLAMEFVHRCTELQTFTLSFGDHITDGGLKGIMSMKKLTKLKLRKCSGFSTEAIVDCFNDNDSLAQLTVFDMSECIEFNDTVVHALVSRCRKLRELSLAWCWEISDDGVSAIVDHCPALRRLDLTGLDKIKGDAFEATPKKIPELVYLNLGQCNQINDELLCGVVAKMPRLTAYNYYGQVFGTEDGGPETDDI